jgi:hypothetical protein
MPWKKYNQVNTVFFRPGDSGLACFHYPIFSKASPCFGAGIAGKNVKWGNPPRKWIFPEARLSAV